MTRSGFELDRAGDADPLPLAAGELVRVLRPAPRGQARPDVEQLAVTAGRPLCRSARCRARCSGSVSDRLDGLPRVQAGQRVLEDHLHAAGACAAAARRLSAADVLPSKIDRAPGRLAPAAASPGRAWTCRSRTPPPARRSCPRSTRGRRRRPPGRAPTVRSKHQPALDREVHLQALDAEQHVTHALIATVSRPPARGRGSGSGLKQRSVAVRRGPSAAARGRRRCSRRSG